MTLEEFARDQLVQRYSRIHFDKDTSSKIRNWCITVWAGTIALANSDRLTLTLGGQVVLTVAPIVCFWFLDALQHMFIGFHISHADKLERFLLGLDSLDANALYLHTLENVTKGVSYPDKLRAFARCALGKETVTTFYLLLLVATAIVVGVVHR